MKRPRLLAALAVLLLASAPLGAQARRPAPETRIWTGSSGGFSWAWTDRDLRASVGGRRVWSGRTVPERDAARMSECTEYSVGMSLLSVVGPVASYEETTSWYCPGAAHPSGYTAYVAVDATRPRARPKLTDWFREEDVRAALLADPVVRRTLAEAEVRTPPARLDALVKALSEASPGCEYSFPEDLLSRFAFHHLEGGKVAVRLGLSHGCEVMRGNLTPARPPPPRPGAPARLPVARGGGAGGLPRRAPPRRHSWPAHRAGADPAAAPLNTGALGRRRGAPSGIRQLAPRSNSADSSGSTPPPPVSGFYYNSPYSQQLREGCEPGGARPARSLRGARLRWER